jgi:hypothetical protein
MRFRTLAGALMAPALAISAASAQTGSAATCATQSPPLSAVTFGSGSNSADKTQVVCNDFGGGVFVDMAAIARVGGGNSPPPVVEVSPGVYMVQNGSGLQPALAQWNFNYAIVGTTGGVFQLLVDRDAGLGTTFQTFLLNVTDNPDTQLSYQNSENEGFFNLPGDVFDPNQTGPYTIEVQQLDAIGGRAINTASINVVVASPEPASIALFATGLSGLGLGGVVRRRRNSKTA